ncbi:MAG: hypothetical protein IJY85_00475 [Ruminococcus sp.]|nr:hypothetical protein [Ruminococcus sp.]
MTTGTAILEDGTRLPYVITDNPPRGGMKYTYFAPDKSYVVQFFNDPREAENPYLQARLSAIIGKYNPTRAESDGGAQGNTPETAAYFQKRYCWPTAIVTSPEFGIVCPAYPQNFFFGPNAAVVPELNLAGKDKRSSWFTSKNRRFLERGELGNFRNMLYISICLARAVRRMHQAGLAHSDLSSNNVLIDPQTGTCVVIDIDTLVVPGLYPPEVVGTRGYVAPEVLATMELDFRDPRRRLPSVYSDLHALAVLIYEYLLLRHPLIGPKIHDSSSPERDDHLSLGERALFVEHPTDHSNRPDGIHVTIDALGPKLKELFLKAFVDGLHNPDARPTAMDWEKALCRAADLLHPCSNPHCAAKEFILHDPKNPICPFCGMKVQTGQILTIRQKSLMRGKQGQFLHAGEFTGYDGMPLFRWHFYANSYPDEKTSREMLGYLCRSGGEWLLVNQAAKGLTSPGGHLVPPGKAILLRNGTAFRVSDDPRGYLFEVQVTNI